MLNSLQFNIQMNKLTNLCPEYARIQSILPRINKNTVDYFKEAVQYNSMLADIAEENGYLELAEYHRYWAEVWKLTLAKREEISPNLAPAPRERN